MSARRSYAFGDFTLDLGRGALLQAGADVKLRPKSFEVLRRLVERHGQLVTKNELLDAVWGQTIVTEGSLTQCLIDVRRAIGDETQRIVRTVPRRGYIFDVPVSELDASTQPGVPVAERSIPAAQPARSKFASRGAWLALIGAVFAIPAAWWLMTTRGVDAGAIAVQADVARAPENSIAVLPFVNMSPDPDQEYFSEGVSEEILNLLAQAPDLLVIARTSSFSFKGQNVNVADIAGKLNVAYVLEGSVRKSGDRLRITAQLVDAANSTHLWSKTYDRDERDTFAVQSEIASRVAEALKTTLADKHLVGRGTGANPAAREDFMRARFFHHRRGPGDIERSRQYYIEALQLDPRYARAWAGLAGVYGVQISEGAIPVKMGLEKRLEAVEQALLRDPDLAEGHIRAAEYYWETGDGSRAAVHAARAYEIDPGDPLVAGHFCTLLAWQDRFDEALTLERRVVRLDPFSLVPRMNLANMLLAAGHLDEARNEILKIVELNPEWRAAVDVELTRLLILQSHPEQALEHVRQWPEGYERDHGLALAYQGLGQHAEAQAAIQRLIQRPEAGSAVRLAEIYAHRGDIDASFLWMTTAYERLGQNAWLTPGWRWLLPLRFSPFLQPLHADTRWQAMRTRGLPPGAGAAVAALPERFSDARWTDD